MSRITLLDVPIGMEGGKRLSERLPSSKRLSERQSDEGRRRRSSKRRIDKEHNGCIKRTIMI